MYDITKATAIKKDDKTIGYIFQLNEETWLPLTIFGEPVGPPSYKSDAKLTVERRDAGATPLRPTTDNDYHRTSE